MEESENLECEKPIFVLKRTRFGNISNFVISVIFIPPIIKGIVTQEWYIKLLLIVALALVFYFICISLMANKISLFDDFVIFDFFIFKKRVKYEKIREFVEINPTLGVDLPIFYDMLVMVDGTQFMKSQFDERDYEKFKNLLNSKIKENK